MFKIQMVQTYGFLSLLHNVSFTRVKGTKKYNDKYNEHSGATNCTSNESRSPSVRCKSHKKVTVITGEWWLVTANKHKCIMIRGLIHWCSTQVRQCILRTRTRVPWTRTRTPGLVWTRGVQELDSALYDLELINYLYFICYRYSMYRYMLFNLWDNYFTYF